MKELLENLERKKPEDVQQYYLVDTCFLIDMMSYPEKINKMKKLVNIAMTSFNTEELMRVEHRLHDKIKQQIRNFLKHRGDIIIVDIPVSPGNRGAEEKYVASVDNHLLELIPDASDAVLIATAIVTHSDVLTKDKHHLYTTVLENYLDKYDIDVLNKLP